MCLNFTDGMENSVDPDQTNLSQSQLCLLCDCHFSKYSIQIKEQLILSYNKDTMIEFYILVHTVQPLYNSKPWGG